MASGEAAGAVAEGVDLDSHALGEVDKEIAEGDFVDAFAGHFAKLAMLITATGKDDGEVGVFVGIGIANAAAEDDGGGVQEGAVAVLHLGEAGDEFAELGDLVFFQGDEVGDDLGVVVVMGKAVVGLVDAEVLRQEVAADFEGGDAGGVGLKGEGDQLIKHGQIFDAVAVGRAIKRGLGLGLVGPALAEFEALFDVAHGGEVFVELGFVFAVDLTGEAVGFFEDGVEDGGLDLVFLNAAGLAVFGVANEQSFEEFGGASDGRDADAGLGPGDLAAAVDAAFGADGEGGETGLEADFIGQVLVDGDVAMWAVLGLGIEDAGEEGVDGEVAAFDAVIKAAEDGEVAAVVPQWLKEGGLFVIAPGGGGEELLGLEPEEVADGDEAVGPCPGAFGSLYGGIATDGLGHEGGQTWQGQGGTNGAKEEAAVHGARRKVAGFSEVKRGRLMQGNTGIRDQCGILAGESADLPQKTGGR